MKENALNILNKIENELKQLRIKLRQMKTEKVYRIAEQQFTRQICTNWFENAEPILLKFGVSNDIRKKYHNMFTTLLQLSIKPSCRTTYLKILDEILQNFRDDMFVPIMKSADQITSVIHLEKILENATEEEKDYLNEALGCASRGFYRASIVLGWNAAIYRIHKIIEKLGFNEFNKKTEEMKSITEGRFKRFKKSFTVHSLSDLRATVFDNELLWVLEYWGLIDSNQHDRLSICLTMRNNSAHPGEAPITEENLASFYSDLKTIIFDNPRFKF